MCQVWRRDVCSVLVGNLSERGHLEDLGIEGRKDNVKI